MDRIWKPSQTTTYSISQSPAKHLSAPEIRSFTDLQNLNDWRCVNTVDSNFTAARFAVLEAGKSVFVLKERHQLDSNNAAFKKGGAKGKIPSQINCAAHSFGALVRGGHLSETEYDDSIPSHHRPVAGMVKVFRDHPGKISQAQQEELLSAAAEVIREQPKDAHQATQTAS